MLHWRKTSAACCAGAEFQRAALAEGAAKLDEAVAQPWQHFRRCAESDGDSQARDEAGARALPAAGARVVARPRSPLKARALEAPVVASGLQRPATKSSASTETLDAAALQLFAQLQHLRVAEEGRQLGSAGRATPA